jgi:hypothetical protein
MPPDAVLFIINGIKHYVEPTHGYYPPIRVRADGCTPYERQWGERRPFWDAYAAWERGGRVVTEEGVAVWESGGVG